jgi:signal transduction histidine kinase
MNSNSKQISSHRFLLTHILGVSTLVLITILFSLIYISEKQAKAELVQHTTTWASSLAKLSIPYLQQTEEEAHQKLKEQFKQVITFPDINYIHVYKKLKNNQVTYFSGFNKNIYFSPIPDKIESIEKLSKINHLNNYNELIIKIEQDQQLYGYLYIQTSNEAIKDFISTLTFVSVALFIIALCCLTVLSIYIHKKINAPIKTVIESIQIISQNKDFSLRIDKLPFTELDILARTINILLTRIENHTLKQSEIHQQSLQQNNQLTEKVQTRTDALKQSNKELLSTLEKLHQFQGQLVETEKMASLGDMVAGIAHEINTPIGLGITASTLLEDRLKAIKFAFNEKTLTSSQLKRFLVDGEENIDIIYRNLDRAASLISNFKKVAVDQSNADIQQFNINSLLEEVTLTLKAKIEKENVNLTLNCPDNLLIESKPGAISQILINLIMNSIIHGFDQRSQGKITISISYLSDQLHISYQDDGTGIDEKIKSKVFDPFITTKRGSGGSGLGLHLVFNLVTQALNGHIAFESEVEQGTKFNITFPVTVVSKL